MKYRERLTEDPDLVKRIMANAETMEHPDQKVTLYKDVDYTAESLSLEIHSAQKKRRVGREIIDKPSKKPKTDPISNEAEGVMHGRHS